MCVLCGKLLQLCLTLRVMDCSPPGSSVQWILQARILKWVAKPFSRGSSWSRDWTWVSYLLHWQVSSLPLALLGKPVYLQIWGAFQKVACWLLVWVWLCSSSIQSQEGADSSENSVSGKKGGKFVFHWSAKKRKNDMLSSSLDNLSFLSLVERVWSRI